MAIARHTEQRQWTLRVVKATREPLTAEQVFAKVKRHIASVNLTTTYRNLGVLAKRGEIYVLENCAGKKQFFGHTFHHQTFRCQRCGREDKLALEDLADAVKYRLRKQPIFYSELQVVGLCPACARALAARKGR